MNKLMKQLENCSFSSFKEQILNLNSVQLNELKDCLDDLYYNTGESTFPDERYDAIVDKINVRKVGSKLRDTDNKVKLPHKLGSMDKIQAKEEDAKKLNKFVKEYRALEYVLSDKLDGVSCLLTYKAKTGEINLYTRGDSEEGSNISYIQNIINFIPKLSLKSNLSVRGELIISKVNYKKHSSTYKNPRNMVSGIINAKTLKEGARDIDFIAYEIINDEDESEPILEQYDLLHSLNFKVVNTVVVSEKEMTISGLLTKYIEIKHNSPYEIDGIIVRPNIPYFRDDVPFPKYAFAFKAMLGDNLAKSKVIDVKWNVSMRGFLKPTVVIEPTYLCGATISNITAFNAKFVVDNNINKGVTVEFTRSNDVIPYIVRVLDNENVNPNLPSVNCKWNETNVDLILDEEKNDDLSIKIITNFFNVLEVKNLNEGIVTKIYNEGYKTVVDFVSLNESDLMRFKGFQKTLSKKIVEGIREGLNNITMIKLITASGLFGLGMGAKKIKTLCTEIPDLLKYDTSILEEKSKLTQKITELQGFSNKSASQIVNNIDSFKQFYKLLEPHLPNLEESKEEESQHSLHFLNYKIVFTGFRDPELQRKIEDLGGEVTTSVSKKTSLVVCANKNENSLKLAKAKELGIKLLTITEFQENYKKFF